MSSRRSGRASGVSRDPPSSLGDSRLSLTVKVSSNKLREVTRGTYNRRGSQFEGGEILQGKRNRGTKKSYVVDSSPEPDDDEEEAEIEVEEEDDDDMEEDAEGEDEMDIDAEGEDIDAEGDEDAEGDMDIDLPPLPAIKVSRPPLRTKPLPRASASKVIPDDDDDEDDEDDDDDDDLSDPADSDAGDQTLGFGDETMVDEDAEGEEIEVAGELVEDDEVDAESEAEAGGSQDESMDLTKMTKRQRARFGGNEGDFMKLSDEVQVKKHFTAEELSMRRQEMARRRRNLSEKRNEEVKMETINKLLKKQAPKTSRKAAGAESPDEEASRANPVFIRWVSNRNGSRVGVADELLQGPAGKVFVSGTRVGMGKMVEEVA